MRRQPGQIIILEDAKFDWTPQQIELAIELFDQKKLPSEVAGILGVKDLDIGLLLLHLIDKGKVKP